MAVKLLMHWDIDKDKESDYYNFIVHDFIPRIQRLGLRDIQFWYTTYGKCEQIQASGIVDDSSQAHLIMGSDDWRDLQERLGDMVTNYDQKLVAATNGFQL